MMVSLPSRLLRYLSAGQSARWAAKGQSLTLPAIGNGTLWLVVTAFMRSCSSPDKSGHYKPPPGDPDLWYDACSEVTAPQGIFGKRRFPVRERAMNAPLA